MRAPPPRLRKKWPKFGPCATNTKIVCLYVNKTYSLHFYSFKWAESGLANLLRVILHLLLISVLRRDKQIPLNAVESSMLSSTLKN